MKRAILALSLLAVLPTSAVESKTTEQLPACKTGWKIDSKLPALDGRYIPVQFVLAVTDHVARGTVIWLVTSDGRLKTIVQRGQSVALDCFDDDGKDTF